AAPRTMPNGGGLWPRRITSSKGLLDPPSTDSRAAYFLRFSTGHQSDHHRDDHQDNERKENFCRREKTCPRCWSRRRRRCVLRRQSALSVLEAFWRLLIVGIHFQRLLVISNRFLVLLR